MSRFVSTAAAATGVDVSHHSTVWRRVTASCSLCLEGPLTVHVQVVIGFKAQLLLLLLLSSSWEDIPIVVVMGMMEVVSSHVQIRKPNVIGQREVMLLR